MCSADADKHKPTTCASLSEACEDTLHNNKQETEWMHTVHTYVLLLQQHTPACYSSVGLLDTRSGYVDAAAPLRYT